MSQLSMKQKLGYGTGDLASNLVFQLTVIFLLYFYTDVFGISAIAAGIIFLVARIWDAVNDPIMGVIIDHTNSKHGKERVYLRYGSIPLAIATILMFFTPNISQNHKIVYALITYIIWGMCYTMVNIPYSSLTAVMTDDPQERTSLSSIRMIFMLIGVLMVSIIAEPLVGAFSNANNGYFVTSIIFAVLSFVFFQVCFYATKSSKTCSSKVKEHYKLKQIWPILRKNNQLWIVTIASLLGNIGVFMRESCAIYYVTYNMGDQSLLGLFLGIIVISMVIANLVIPAITKKLDKKGTYMLGAGIAVLTSIAFFFIPPTSFVAILVTASISSMGFAFVSTLGWAMVPDTVEYGEKQTGIKSEGIIYAVYSFSQKLATAVSGLIVAAALEYSGYVEKAVQQSELSQTWIAMSISVLPAILVFASMLVLIGYKINRNYFNTLEM